MNAIRIAQQCVFCGSPTFWSASARAKCRRATKLLQKDARRRFSCVGLVNRLKDYTVAYLLSFGGVASVCFRSVVESIRLVKDKVKGTRAADWRNSISEICLKKPTVCHSIPSVLAQSAEFDRLSAHSKR